MSRLAGAWLLGLCAMGCAAGPAPVTTRPGDLDGFGWLVGHWSGEGTEERWVQPHPKILLGTNRTLKGGEVVAREHLQIDTVGGRVVYRAWPHSQPPAAFELVEAGSSWALFANPAHDFPRRIRYERKGEVLRAGIEGKGRTSAWTWRRREAAAPAVLRKEVTVKAAPGEIWKAWTTLSGVKSFFAPNARLELRPGGAYELYFNPEAPAGERGCEGCTLIEIAAPRRLAFTWNFPTKLAAIRKAHTLVTVELTPAGEGQTRVVLTQGGWRDGPDWVEGRAYFERAWGIVLTRLKQRFDAGPIDWSAP